MNRVKLTMLVSAVFVSALLVTGCVAVMPRPPLPSGVRVVPVAPPIGIVATSGHWQWSRRAQQYVWVPGYRGHGRVVVRVRR